MKARSDSAINRKAYLLESKIDLIRKHIELHSPKGKLNDRISKLDNIRVRLDTSVTDRIKSVENRFRLACATLEGNNPLAILSRGYAVAENEKGEILTSVDGVGRGDTISVRLSDGIVRACVADKEKIRKEK